MSSFPRDPAPDATLALLRDGYEFVPKRCRRLGSDAFETRLMLSKAVCASGEDAARMFYHPGRFTRDGALPPTALRLLQDKGSVAVHDGAAHAHRKRLFLGVLTPEAVGRLVERFEAEWRAALGRWAAGGPVVLHTEAEGVLCRAVCAWAGVPLGEAEAAERTREFAAMIDGAGAVGPRVLRGLFRRRRTERWAEGLIGDVRAGRRAAPDGTAAHAVAHFRDLDGKLLPPEVAAVELINVLRPTVAVARFVTFAALALQDHPGWPDRLRAGGDAERTAFAQEVRRFYPFFPLVGGRVREPFAWRGRPFAPGEWVLLDLYGTNHDPRTWPEPERFRPDRFLDRPVGPHDMVPQGGGDMARDHRCPGEGATIELIEAALRLLTREMRYEVPPQDLRVRLNRMPAIPESRFVIAGVRRA